jgi:hypothetical protein
LGCTLGVVFGEQLWGDGVVGPCNCLDEQLGLI